MTLRTFATIASLCGALCGATAGLSVVACSGPPDGQKFLLQNVPPFAGDAGTPARFRPVNEALEVHCGTLDCHGAPARNMRLYGISGVRLDPHAIPGGAPKPGQPGQPPPPCPDCRTSEKELLANYESLIAIQPEVLNTIVAQHGVRPERWLVITKGRGTEHHKGESRMSPGDDTDRCITSWLTGVLDEAACGNAGSIQLPMGAGFDTPP
jgi:hypothetical protein